MTAPANRCRECGCTDTDCRGCIERTGRPCSWTSDAQDLCTACARRPRLHDLAAELAESTAVGELSELEVLARGIAAEVGLLVQERNEARSRLAILDATGADMDTARAVLDVVHPYAWNAEHMAPEHYEAAARAMDLVPALLVDADRLRSRVAHLEREIKRPAEAPTREGLVKLAREAAAGVNRPSYCHNPPAFDPHEWVLDAMLLAFKAGAGRYAQEIAVLVQDLDAARARVAELEAEVKTFAEVAGKSVHALVASKGSGHA